jgi:ABC transporter DrrB family efflux protein
MSSATRAPRSRVSLAQGAKDTLVITRRNVRRIIRLPELLVFATIQPVMFLLLFTYVFGGSIGQTIPPAAGGEYINYLLPGLLVQLATFGAVATAVGLTEDMSKGVIDRFRSLPMARSAVLAGRTAADLARNAFVVVLLVVVGTLIGFRYQTTFADLVLALLLLLAYGYSISWGMSVLGLVVKTPEAVQTAAFLVVFPLVFASSIFVPTSTLPSWLQTFADHQPVTATANAMRGLTLGEGALPAGTSVTESVLIALAWIVAILLVFVPLAVRRYRRTVGGS